MFSTFTVCALEHLYHLLSQHLSHVFLLHFCFFVAKHNANQGNQLTTLIVLDVYIFFYHVIACEMCGIVATGVWFWTKSSSVCVQQDYIVGNNWLNCPYIWGLPLYFRPENQLVCGQLYSLTIFL